MSNAPILPKIGKIRGFGDSEIDVDYYMRETYDDVTTASVELPTVIETLNELRQAYVEERGLAKVRLAEATAEAYFDLRGTGTGSFSESYPGKMTEDALKMAVVLDPAVKELNARLVVNAAMVNRLSGAIQSFQAKVELLRSSEATRRAVLDDEQD